MKNIAFAALVPFAALVQGGSVPYQPAEQFMYVLKATRPAMLVSGPTPAEAATIERHNAHLRRLAGEGIVLLAGRTQNTDSTAFGIIIFQASSRQEAQRLVDADPFIKEGVARATLFPYKISYMSDKIRVTP